MLVFEQKDNHEHTCSRTRHARFVYMICFQKTFRICTMFLFCGIRRWIHNVKTCLFWENSILITRFSIISLNIPRGLSPKRENLRSRLQLEEFSLYSNWNWSVFEWYTVCTSIYSLTMTCSSSRDIVTGETCFICRSIKWEAINIFKHIKIWDIAGDTFSSTYKPTPPQHKQVLRIVIASQWNANRERT